MKIPTPTADELQSLVARIGSADELTNSDWVIIAACVASVAMLQILMESGATIGPFETVDDGRPNSVIEAILLVEVKKP